MRYSLHPALAFGLLGLLFVQPATAQVYQCLDANGKKVFSQTPCAALGGSSEKLIMQAPAGGTAVTGKPKDWAAENAAANARAAAAEESAAASRQATPAPGGLRKGTVQAQASDKQIIANCEASRGARCGSASEIAQRRMEQRELTPSERQQQQSAVAARRRREQNEAIYRSTRR